MPMILVAALMMAQAPAAAQPALPAPAAQPKAKKPKQICENIEVTGSRRPQRVCRDEDGVFKLGSDVANSAPNAGMFHPPPPAPQPVGLGGPPR